MSVQDNVSGTTTVITVQKPYLDIYEERICQEGLVKSGKFLWTCATTSPSVSLDRKMSVLSEEHGEVGREVVEYGITEDKYVKDNLHFPPHRRRYYLERIRKELVQVAAVCVAWIEAIDEQLKELS
jgi:NTP pyrophosphatase (non-canonical NTP hydrolase)